MVEPLRPEAREALKESNPGLTDEDLDRFEEILIERVRLDEEVPEDRVRAQVLDRKRAALLKERMPNYQQVMKMVMMRDRQAGVLPKSDDVSEKVDIVIKKNSP